MKSYNVMTTKELLESLETCANCEEQIIVGELLRRAGLYAVDGNNTETLIDKALRNIQKRSVTLYQTEDTVEDGDAFTELLTYDRENAIEAARDDWDHLANWEKETHSISVNVYSIELPADSEFTAEEAYEYTREHFFDRLGTYNTIEWR